MASHFLNLKSCMAIQQKLRHQSRTIGLHLLHELFSVVCLWESDSCGLIAAETSCACTGYSGQLDLATKTAL